MYMFTVHNAGTVLVLLKIKSCLHLKIASMWRPILIKDTLINGFDSLNVHTVNHVAFNSICNSNNRYCKFTNGKLKIIIWNNYVMTSK